MYRHPFRALFRNHDGWPFGWCVTKLFSCGFQYFNHSLIRKVFKPELNLIHSCSCSIWQICISLANVLLLLPGARQGPVEKDVPGITFLLVIYCCLLMIYIIYGFRTSVTTVICIEIQNYFPPADADFTVWRAADLRVSKKNSSSWSM